MTPTTLTESPPPPSASGESADSVSDLSDEALVERFKAGHRGALQIIHDRHHADLIRYARSKGLGCARAEDVASQTWRKVVQHAFRYDPDQSQFSTWVRTIHGNLIKNLFRNRDRDPVSAMSDVMPDPDSEDRDLAEGDLYADESHRPDDAAEKREVRRRVEAAIERLPVHLRLTFLLRYRCGMKYRKMSDVTGVKLGTVKSRLNRARKSFVEIMTDDAPDVLNRLGLRPEVESDHWNGT